MNLIKQVYLMEMHRNMHRKITVTALCQKAGINRSTFYEYYRDTDDLVADIKSDCVKDAIILYDQIIERNVNDQAADITESILKYIYDHKDILNVLLLQYHDETFWEELNQKIMDLYKIKVRQQHKEMDCIDQRTFDRAILFLSNGFYSIYKDWLVHDCAENIKAIASFTTEMSDACLIQMSSRHQCKSSVQ